MSDEVNNMMDLIDSRDVIARIEELQEDRVNWVAGWNMPGCMPDMEPMGFTEWEDARDALISELEGRADDDEAYDLVMKAVQDVHGADDDEEIGVQVPGDLYYFLTRGDGKPEDPDDAEELEALEALQDEAESYAVDWRYGEVLIRDSYFTDYAQELAEDIGAVNNNASWPNTCIDWEQAARELQMDYTAVDFDGVTYWVR